MEQKNQKKLKIMSNILKFNQLRGGISLSWNAGAAKSQATCSFPRHGRPLSFQRLTAARITTYVVNKKRLNDHEATQLRDIGAPFQKNDTPGGAKHRNSPATLGGSYSQSVRFAPKSEALLCVFSFMYSSEPQFAHCAHRFINFLTKKGKKATAESLFLKTLYLLSQKVHEVEVLSARSANGSSSLFSLVNQAIENVKPLFEVKKVRVAGTTYQVPSLVEQNRQENLAMNWLIQSAKERKKKNPSQSFESCLAFEIFEAFQKQGQARNKRNELHKLAETNRAFSHFRWW